MQVALAPDLKVGSHVAGAHRHLQAQKEAAAGGAAGAAAGAQGQASRRVSRLNRG